MSDLIASWLNDEVQLSKRITNFENDFENGYLFGELLSKYNQELNFPLFLDKDTRNEKINNYKLLEPTFKTLKIDFNAQIADGIIKREKGVALRILYRLKMALEKVHNPADIKVFDETGKLNTIVPLKQLRPAREKYDKMESFLFTKRLNQLNRAQKDIDLDKKLERFRSTMDANTLKAEAKRQEELERDRQIKDERRKIELNKLQRNITFMEDWQAKGWNEWRKNQARKHDREQKDKDFAKKTTMKARTLANVAVDNERREVLDGIDAFEANAGRLGIELEHDPENGKKTEKSTFSVGVAAATTLTLLKEKTKKSEASQRERDKRRRKMIVDQNTSQKDIELKKREAILFEKLQQQSKQENEIAYEVWRALQCKQVIIENRTLRNENYGRKREDQKMIAQAKEEDLLEQIRSEKDRDLNQKMFRQRELNIHYLSEKRLNDHKTCSKFFDYIFEIADLCFQHQQDSDNLNIDPRFWRDCCNLFVENKPLLPKKTFRHFDSTGNLTRPATDNIQVTLNHLSMAELSDYLNGLGAWRPSHHFEGPKDDEDNTYIPNQPINNFKLGFIISNIIDMKYPKKQPRITPAEIPNYLPLRMLCLGYAFSGRKTLCQFLQQKYDIQVLHINEILKEALELSSENFLDDQNSASNEDENGDKVRTENELSVIGREMKQYLVNGQNIPDELFTRAIIHKVRGFYPSLTNDEFLDELKRLRAEEDKLIKEKEQARRENSDGSEYENDDEEVQEAVVPLGHNYTKGWILMGYPNNYEQLKSLEEALSGFIPADEEEVPEAESRKERAEIVVKAPPKVIEPRKLVKGGIDAAIILDVTKEECLRRALGRRLDPLTGTIYHLEDNPPPTDQSPLIERLIPINDPENSEASLIDKLTVYDKSRENMENWLRTFGIEEAQLSCLQVYDGFGTRENIHQQVQDYLDQILAFKSSEYQRRVDEIEEVKKKQELEEEARKLQELEDAKMVVTEPQTITQEFDKLQEKRIANLTIPHELLNVMNSFWETIQENYLRSSTDVFTEIKEQRNFLSIRIGELQRRFLEIIQKEDDKMLLVLKFQKEYNHFLEENPDMIEDADTKEELHQRVEDLYQQLWEITETKKEEAIEERKAVMSSGYIEDEMEAFLTNIQKLMQAELDRNFGCIQLIQDYYNVYEGKDLAEQQTENILPDILPRIENLPPIEDHEGTEPFPRLELLYKNAVQLLNGEELEDPTAVKDPKKGGKAAPPAKKDDPKKAAAPAKKDKEVVQEEEKKELTPLEKEMKETISTEKAIMRYRLYLIKTIAASRLTEMRDRAKELYNKLEDWINYSNKAENDAIAETAKILGDAIENQTKVQSELQLHYVDVVSNNTQLNFLTPPPVPLTPREIKQSNRFTITQLKSVLQQLRLLTQPSGVIDDSALLQFLNQRTSNLLGKDEFPEDWRTKDFRAYQKLVKNLDKGCKGYVPFKTLGNYLCLLSTVLPRDDDVLEYQTELVNNSENGLITKEAFIETRAFFDIYELSSQTEHNSDIFLRHELIKDLLFEINKDQEKNLMDVNEYVKAITNFSLLTADPADLAKADLSIQSNNTPMKSPNKSPKKPKKRPMKSYTNLLFD